MKTAEANIYLDELRPKKNGKCSVKIKVTFNRKRKYFSTGIELTNLEFNQIMDGKRKTEEQKEINVTINDFYNKATEVIKNLKVFTFTSFQDAFLSQRNLEDSVSSAFKIYIAQLKTENRIATASSYQCTINSLELFKKNLTFAEINPSFLKNYEKSMLQNNKSVTTIGIYLRTLRAIYNLQNIDSSIYPFGEGNNKYSIPASRNIKKALTIEEIAKIYNYEAISKSTKEMAKDYWLFLYLCNGMNVKDFCMLKWVDIQGDMLTYKRAKTLRSKKESKGISVAIKSETLEIINKWGNPSTSKDDYIFPHLKKEMSAERGRVVYQQLTKIINKYIKQICNELDINKNVTTYFARHSFATVLKRSGANISLISDLLGHSSLGVTESYLDSFEKEQIQKETEALTIGFKKSNQ
jgi:integrase/recombinase XerD